MTLREALLYGEKLLRDGQITEWKVDARYLLEYIIQEDRSFFFLNERKEIPAEQLLEYQNVLELRKKRIPLQYITKSQEFMGISFFVTPDVLIPRQDTECLVLEAEKYLKKGMDVLDMCTGSGCIIVSLKKRNPDFLAEAVDISAEAICVARENAKRNDVSIQFVQADLFEGNQKKYDLIVSNPPYIPTEEISGLMEEVKGFEPMLALDGCKDGLAFYRRIVKEANSHLKPKGMLFFEIGCTQAEAVVQLMEAEGFFNINVIKDLAGLDRVVYGGKKNV